MGAVVVDSSLVIAFLTPDDALHRSAVHAIGSVRETGDDFILPASVLAEVLVHPYRISAVVGDSSGRAITEFFGSPRSLDQEVAIASARLRAGHRSLRLPDALVVATGMVDRATTLTFDQRLAGVDGSVRVLAP